MLSNGEGNGVQNRPFGRIDMPEQPTLFVCHGDDGGPRFHPCRRVQEVSSRRNRVSESHRRKRGFPTRKQPLSLQFGWSRFSARGVTRCSRPTIRTVVPPI